MLLPSLLHHLHYEIWVEFGEVVPLRDVHSQIVKLST
jgi:hypothetical protein